MVRPYRVFVNIYIAKVLYESISSSYTVGTACTSSYCYCTTQSAVNTHTYTHTHPHTQTHTYTHTHTHTHRGIVLKDLVAIDSQAKDYSDPSQQLMNMTKYRLLWNILSSIRQAQLTPPDGPPDIDHMRILRVGSYTCS